MLPEDRIVPFFWKYCIKDHYTQKSIFALNIITSWKSGLTYMYSCVCVYMCLYISVCVCVSMCLHLFVSWKNQHEYGRKYSFFGKGIINLFYH